MNDSLFISKRMIICVEFVGNLFYIRKAIPYSYSFPNN